ncbi:MAG TPA: hypothetical protein VGR26_09085 [Acidimicrobiales bacterium]|nr:hypothetical protein [Acidimicrobiales bacterium]
MTLTDDRERQVLELNAVEDFGTRMAANSRDGTRGPVPVGRRLLARSTT